MQYYFIAVCGGTFYSAYRGKITSPNYPDAYSSNTDCVWRIVVHNGATIMLNFTELDMGYDSDTCLEANDYLEINNTDLAAVGGTSK